MTTLTTLVPLDGSEAAEVALSMLDALRPLGDLRVRLLSVAESGQGTPPDVEKVRQRLAADYLDGVANRFPHLRDDTEYIRRTGLPRDEIIDEASREDVDLLLLTTHGQTSRDPVRLGSVADRVVRGASCPVLLVNPRARVPETIELIAVPLDGSVAAMEALPLAAKLAARMKATLRLVSVVARAVSHVSDSTGNARGLDAVLEQPALRYLKEAKAAVADASVVETAVLSGPAAETLLADFQERRPDLVVMTAHGKRGFIPWALGSVTERLIISSGVPILVLRRDPASPQARSLAETLGS